MMHVYAVADHSRTVIGRYLGLGAVALTSGASAILLMLSEATGWDIVAGVTITSSIVFTGIHWIFNRWGWKLPWVTGFPNVEGLWRVKGKTLDEAGSICFEWEGQLDIKQEYEKISVSLKTKQSASESDIVYITKKPGNKGGWILSYGYQNHPKAGEYHELNSHRGFCEILFNEELTSGSANYLNNNGRRTQGVMELERQK